jgi:SOS response regulatory protein OraA/RecX
LTKAGVGDAARAEALETLERVGYVDDGRVAASRASALASRGYGDDAIRFDLEQRGIGGLLVDEAVSGLEPEASRAAALVERLGRSPKTAGQLLRKGFSHESVESAVGAGIAADWG